MENKKYQVFVSSTYVDLIDARKKIIETVLSLYHFPVGMEMFSADDSEQWDIIKETIDASDYYVIIIGHKYGSVSKDGISYTEMEYNYAKSLNIPVLAFIRGRDVLTKPHERESDPQKEKQLNAFIEKAKANKMCDFWEAIDELATKVAIALPKVMRRNPRTGWVRGDQVASKEITAELAELSNENRKLREKVREYESQLHSDAPQLELSMIDNDLTLSVDAESTYQEYLPQLCKEAVPLELKDTITIDEIESYNSSLPTDKEVDLYNKKMRLHCNYKNNAITVKPVLRNNGRAFASNVYVEIDFPEFLIVLKGSNEDFFIKEPKLKIPESPISKHKKRLSALMSLENFRMGIFDETSIAIANPRFEVPAIINRIADLGTVNQDEWVMKEDHKITLRAKKVLQSLTVEYEEIVIIPLTIGSGVINFKIICEQLKEPVVFSRQVTVTAS